LSAHESSSAASAGPAPDPATGALLADMLDLSEVFETDEQINARTRIERDQALSPALQNYGPTDRIRAWLGTQRDPASESNGERLARARRLTGMLLGILGLLLGWVAAMALFRYNGQHPVNVTWLLAVFVGLQSITLLLFAIAALPASAGRIPVVGSIQRLVMGLSPGRLGFALARFLPQRMRQSLESLSGRTTAFRRIFGNVSRWVVLYWSQIFALAFQVGAITGGLALVLFSDLAFGWSTTLDLGSDAMHRAVSLLALPWQGFAPDAVPSAELVESTRYFRLSTTAATPLDPVTRTQWWPFVLLAMIVYGLLPRLFTVWLSRFRLRANARTAIVNYPGSAALLDRLNPQRVQTTAVEPEVKMAPAAHRELGAGIVSSGAASVINWSAISLESGAIRGVVLETLGVDATDVLSAGGARSLSEDQQTINACVEAKVPVVILVKSWETPMLEFLDFLKDMRSALGEKRAVTVIPVSIDDGQPAAPEPTDASVWAERLETLGDPWLHFKHAETRTPQTP